MLLIYNIGIRFYYLFANIASLFSSKARQWVNGRRNQIVTSLPAVSIWFHFATLGEFEQGRPVLELMRSQHPDKRIVVTFFSPSGYEIRKNSPLADAVYYLPLDTKAHACQFIDTIKPQIAIFTKYEYWYHFFNELHKNNIPLYIISAIFRPEQVFFKWYGSLHRQMLNQVSQLFVQDAQSEELLQTIGVNRVQVIGDTRFDRVWANAMHPRPLPLIQEFKNNSSLFIGGSTWPQDEELLAALVIRNPEWKFIFAQHEIAENKITGLLSRFLAADAVRYSAIETLSQPLAAYRVLVIDNIGMLSALYQYADAAYIGGGFGVGIHNTLEAAAFGLPVIFGPTYHKFREAHELIALNAGFSINNVDEFNHVSQQLITDENFRLQAGAKAKQYVMEHTGATATIVNYIENKSFDNGR